MLRLFNLLQISKKFTANLIIHSLLDHEYFLGIFIIRKGVSFFTKPISDHCSHIIFSENIKRP